MKLYVDQLVIEVTRKCNIQCGHCLRGDAECVNIKMKYVDALFSQISSIGSITFTGGEPQLVPGIIDKIRYSAIIHNIDVGNFYCVTNGVKNSKKFKDVMISWWNFCNDNEISGVDLSNDIWHDEATDYTTNTNYIEDLEFFHKRMRTRQSRDAIINEGRAKFYGNRNNEPDNFCKILYDEDQITITEGTLYLNALGKIINGCNWSYMSQRTRDDIQIGDVMDDSFSLFNWADSLPEQD